MEGLNRSTTHLEVGEELPKQAGAEHKGIWQQLSGAESPRVQKLQHLAIAELLDGFEGVFQEPTGLPPNRSFDHRIQLIEGVLPTCVRPYRYPHYQKEEIEKLVKEMLSTGIIRASQSTYS